MNTKKEKAYQLEQEAQRLRSEAQQEEMRAEIEAQATYRNNEKIDTYIASDYAGLKAGKYEFYFGYEITVCPKHKSSDECSEADCDKGEWAFQATISGKEVMKVPESKLYPRKNESPEFYLLAGIGKFLKSLK